MFEVQRALVERGVEEGAELISAFAMLGTQGRRVLGRCRIENEDRATTRARRASKRGQVDGVERAQQLTPIAAGGDPRSLEGRRELTQHASRDHGWEALPQTAHDALRGQQRGPLE